MPSLILLHTTEHPPLGTFEGVDSYLVRMGYEPNEMFDPQTDRVRQYIAAGVASKALFNAAGGVETNRRSRDARPDADVYQIEIFHAERETHDALWYRRLELRLRFLCNVLDIPYRFPFRHATDYGMAQKLHSAGGTRLTFAEWDDPALTGIVYHANAPENTHWDPTFDPTPLFALNPATEPEMELDDALTISEHDANGNRTTLYHTNVRNTFDYIHDAAERAAARATAANTKADLILARLTNSTPAVNLQSVSDELLLAEVARRFRL